MSQKKISDPASTREQNGEGGDSQNPQQVAAEMAKAFQEIAKGEQTASALERQLDGIESRIEALLAAAEASAAPVDEPHGHQPSHTPAGSK